MRRNPEPGFGHTWATMFVVNTPSQELAFTNFTYCSAGDFQKFAIPGFSPTQVVVGDSVVLPLLSHSNIADGQIALNVVHRRHTKVSAGDQIFVITFFPPASFSLALLILELEYYIGKPNRKEQLDAVVLAQQLCKKFDNQVMTTGQKVLFKFLGTNYTFTVNQAFVEDQEKSNAIERGIITNDTYIIFEAVSSLGIKIINQREAARSNIFRKDFNLQKLGLGGFSEEYAIIRKAFASRILPPHVTNKLDIKYVKGMLFYGPPGTGKTLMARQIGKMLKGREPKIVDGVDLLGNYVGETEKILRNLFADAEQDQRARGDQSDLHVIIIDDIDAICKPRGSTHAVTTDNIVNQFLTKIDGIEALNNILIIGITNRKDLLDKALLRTGRLEVHLKFNLPDENGRFEILQIHTNTMKENSFLAADINLQELAARMNNCTGADIEGIIKSAFSLALSRHSRGMADLTKSLDDQSLKVSMNDFLNGIKEIIPTSDASIDDLQRCRFYGMVECGESHKQVYEKTMLLVEQAKMSTSKPLQTCLLEGPWGSGKTAMAATIGIDSDVPYVKIVSAEWMIGLSESSSCEQIVKVFEEAYMFELSIVILDGIEGLLEYISIGPCFSNLIARTLMVLLKRRPPKGKKMLVIGTTSEVEFLKSINGFCEAFSVTYHVPKLVKEDVIKVLEHLNIFERDDIDAAAEALNGMTLKKLFTVVNRVAASVGRDLEVIYSSKEKIDINHFLDILSDYKSYV